MRFLILTVLFGFQTAGTASADFVLSFAGSNQTGSDFGLTSTFNNVTFFSFEISIDAPLVAGGVYNNPTINSVDYTVHGVLPSATPSGFPGFALVRSMTGNEFYNLSPDSGLDFQIMPSADLTDGLQLSELSGTTPIFQLNAREFNQNPGRYHPPIFTLNSDGTGRLVNANNQSTFNNPPPPMGSGLPVNVQIADEYDIALAFAPASVTIASIPEPSACWFFVISGCFLVVRKLRA